MNIARNLIQNYNKYVIKYPLIGMATTSGLNLVLEISYFIRLI